MWYRCWPILAEGFHDISIMPGQPLAEGTFHVSQSIHAEGAIFVKKSGRRTEAAVSLCETHVSVDTLYQMQGRNAFKIHALLQKLTIKKRPQMGSSSSYAFNVRVSVFYDVI